MKRGLSILLLSLILISSFLVLAANNTDITANITGKVAGFKEKTNTALERDTEIPENLQIITRIFLGIKEEEPISFHQFIVLIVTFIIFFFLMKDIVILIPFFEEGWKTWLGAFIITSLVGLSRGLLVFAGFLMDLGLLFKWISENFLLSLFISIGLLFIIIILVHLLIKKVKNRLRPQIAEEEGYEEGFWNRMHVRLTKWFGEKD